jgi:hypothetical protein
MADKLNELFNDWLSTNPAGDLYQAFQGGLTTGAVSMRTRAMKVVQDWKNIPGMTEVINEIGQLSDIPEE